MSKTANNINDDIINNTTYHYNKKRESLIMPAKTALDRFNTMNLADYGGLAVGIVNGKIMFQNKDPHKVMKQLLVHEDKEVALICVPKTKMAMYV